MAKHKHDPFDGAPIIRDARYDGAVLAHFVRAVIAKRLFKTGV
jgi:hypothetical protein